MTDAPMDQLITRIAELERLVRETRESQARMEANQATLANRAMPGQAEHCRWHEAQLSALREFDSKLAVQVQELVTTQERRDAAAGVWTIMGRVAVGFVGAVFALLGQWGLQAATARTAQSHASPPAAHAPP